MLRILFAAVKLAIKLMKCKLFGLFRKKQPKIQMLINSKIELSKTMHVLQV